MTHLRTLLAGLLLSLWALGATAQTNDGPDYEAWRTLAARAELSLQSGRTSNEVMEQLRVDLAAYRQQFLTASQANASRIATLENQLSALGPPPEDGTPEDSDIAQNRASLTAQIAQLRAPVRAAEAAYNGADGLISEIDGMLRERQTERLLELGPSPVNPVLWTPALSETAQALGALGTELSSEVSSDVNRAELRANAPVVLLLTALGILLVARGRRWSERFGGYLRSFGGRGTGVWGFVVSLGRIVLPLIGLFALTEALLATGMMGFRATKLVEALPVWGAIVLGFRWLCERVFSKQEEDALVEMAAPQRSAARRYGTVLGLLIATFSALTIFAETARLSTPTIAVLSFPLAVLIALALFRLGQLLRSGTDVQADDGEETQRPSGLHRVMRLLGLASMGVAIVAPIMLAIGYSSAGSALLFQTVLSLGLFGLVVVLQRFLADIYGMITGQGTEARDALVPVLLGFTLLLLAAPVLALIWGARVANLTELWTQFREGFAIGDTRISPTDFITFAIIFAFGYLLTRLIQGGLRNSVLPKTKIDMGGQNAIVSGVGYIGIFLAAILAITGAGIDLSSLGIVLGALSVGIGFGLQNIVSNFVSGIILLIERPIAEGDWIEVGGQMGYVRDISVRSTRIETFDRTDVIVPNADLVSGTVTNYTRGNTVGRVIVPVGVAYGTDTRKVEHLLREIANAHPMVLANPAPSVVLQGFGADSLDFEIRAILRDVNWVLSVKSDMNHAIAAKFIEEGIEIPFAQRDLWLRNPEALGQGPETA